MPRRLIFIVLLCLAIGPSISEPVPSFLSPVSFDQNRLHSWKDYFGTCETNPQDVFVQTSNILQVPLFQLLQSQEGANLVVQYRFPSLPFLAKMPTPIKLVFDPDTSCSDSLEEITCIKASINVTDTDKTLFFDARSPSPYYFISYYMNRAGFPFRPPKKSQINFQLNNQIELSVARAVTLSVNANQQRKQTAFNGLGAIDDENKKSTKNVELPYHFINAVFLGASSDVPGYTSHEFADGKRYPMEIYMYFAKELCTLPECTTQLIVLVEESDTENEQIKPVIEMLGAGAGQEASGLYEEEIKFIEKYNFEGLPSFADDLYQRNYTDVDNYTVQVWNIFNTALERLHLGHAYRVMGKEKIERRRSVERQFAVAEQNLIQKCAFFDQNDPNSAILNEFQGNASALEEFTQIYDSLVRDVSQLTTLVQGLLIKGGKEGGGICSYADASHYASPQYASVLFNLTNATAELLETIDKSFQKLDQLGRNTNISISIKPFNATQAVPLEVNATNQFNFDHTSRKKHAFMQTTFADWRQAINTYAYYGFHVVAPRKRDISDFAQLIGFADNWFQFNIWKDALEVLPEYYLTAVKDLSEFTNEKKYLLQQEARNNVPRVQLRKDFQISWLIPSFGGHYEYSGSTPFPPCHQTSRTIVFERPIQMSRSQIEALTRIPTSKNRDEDLTNTRPPFYNIEELTHDKRGAPLLVKYDLKNPQWLGEGDGFHENSIERAKRRKAKSRSATAARPRFWSGLDLGIVLSLLLPRMLTT